MTPFTYGALDITSCSILFMKTASPEKKVSSVILPIIDLVFHILYSQLLLVYKLWVKPKLIGDRFHYKYFTTSNKIFPLSSSNFQEFWL